MLLEYKGFIIGPQLAVQLGMSLTIKPSKLRQYIRTANQRQNDFLVDLSGGLGELVASCTSVMNCGHTMKLLRPAKRVHSLLHVTKLYTTFEIFEDEPSALVSFGKL